MVKQLSVLVWSLNPLCKCGVPSAFTQCHPADLRVFHFEEVPSLLSRKMGLQRPFWALHIFVGGNTERHFPWWPQAALLQLSPSPMCGTTRTGRNHPLGQSEKNPQGEFNPNRSNREPQLQNSLLQGLEQLQVWPHPLHRQHSPGFQRWGERHRNEGLDPDCKAQAQSPEQETCPRGQRGFLTRPHPQLSASREHAPGSQRFYPRI